MLSKPSHTAAQSCLPDAGTFASTLPRAMPSAPTRLQVRELRSPHGGPVSFSLAAGECVVVVGESGAGKSVLLRMLADLDPCDGEVLLDGVARASMTAPAWRAMVVYQAAEPAWWEPTVEQHFAPAQLARAAELLPLLRLKAGILQDEVALLSTGERQRLALIRSLAGRPKVLMLDEPAAALDPAATLALEAVLQAAQAEGTAILLVTHSQEQAARMAQRLFRMEGGQLQPATLTQAGDAPVTDENAAPEPVNPDQTAPVPAGSVKGDDAPATDAPPSSIPVPSTSGTAAPDHDAPAIPGQSTPAAALTRQVQP